MPNLWGNESTLLHITKRMLSMVLLFVVTVRLPVHAQEQTYEDLSLQYGVSARLVVDIPFYAAKGKSSQPKKSKLPALFYRLAITGGVSSNFAVTNVHPSLHCELLLYNGGLGSQGPGYKEGSRTIFDLIWGMTITAGLNNLLYEGNQSTLQYRNVPLYFFSNFALPPLQNPFDHSISLGTNLIFTTGANRRNQRVGFINLHVGPAQLSYYNDGGTPIHESFLGDRRDRYYTGGVLFSYHGDTNTLISSVELSFHKFTGYTNNAFEASGELDFAFVNYKDTTQDYFNKSLWTLTLSNPRDHFGAYIAAYNYDNLDIQHWLHRVGSHSFHVTPYAPFVSIGIAGFQNYTTSYTK
ncbi:MAG TPA: polymorphic toxin type 23 domain-containing protein [Chryseolinea sp.]|nr:polymorphic toxin type 23 domain-containing protein [Chryseolinea sp.]